ncbi:MAG: phosphoesterase RecJ domain protein [Firmicutes bacterium]|nr:phosphoesterase RecJ domain protein [Bacillota bacterium]
MPNGPSFWFDTRIYLAVAAALLVIIVFYNPYVAILGAILLGALYFYGHERHIQQQKALSSYLYSMTHNIEQGSSHALKNLPLVMIIVDRTGRLFWYNDVLTEWFDEEIKVGHSILGLCPSLPLEKNWGKSGQEIFCADDKYYQIIYKPVDYAADDIELMIFYISDITTSEKVKVKSLDAAPVMVTIQIDNYDDVLQGLSENQRTSVLGEVNKLLAAWVTENEAVLKKYADDMYLAVFNRQQLNKCLQEKFDILDKVRAIHVGNKIPVTLSMGVAADEPSVAMLGERAQAGLDLALGRGGDQVAVHLNGKLQFYGGKAKAVEKNTRVKARIVAQALREIIDDADIVLVMGHNNEDFDSLGAAIGVAAMVRQLGKYIRIVVSHPGVSLSKLKEILGDNEEYQEIFITQAEALALITPRTLVFVVDVHHPELTAAPELLAKVDRIVVIDHHRRSEAFIINPLLVYLEPSASSTCELVTELLMYFDDYFNLNKLDATALYAGIVVDTKQFAVQSGVRTFDAAAYLRRAGADPALVRQMFRSDLETIKARAEILNQAEMLLDGVVVADCPPNIKNAQIVASQVADMLLNIEGVRVSFVLFALDEGVGVSARSNGDINVHVIMEELGGGGHQTVAGAQVRKSSIQEVKHRVIELSAQYIEESGQNESNSTTRG